MDARVPHQLQGVVVAVVTGSAVVAEAGTRITEFAAFSVARVAFGQPAAATVGAAITAFGVAEPAAEKERRSRNRGRSRVFWTGIDDLIVGLNQDHHYYRHHHCDQHNPFKTNFLRTANADFMLLSVSSI